MLQKISKSNTNVPKFVAVWVRGSVRRYLCIYYSGMSCGYEFLGMQAFVNIGFPLCRDLLGMYVSIYRSIYVSIHPSIHPASHLSSIVYLCICMYKCVNIYICVCTYMRYVYVKMYTVCSYRCLSVICTCVY